MSALHRVLASLAIDQTGIIWAVLASHAGEWGGRRRLSRTDNQHSIPSGSGAGDRLLPALGECLLISEPALSEVICDLSA